MSSVCEYCLGGGMELYPVYDEDGDRSLLCSDCREDVRAAQGRGNPNYDAQQRDIESRIARERERQRLNEKEMDHQ